MKRREIRSLNTAAAALTYSAIAMALLYSSLPYRKSTSSRISIP